MDVLDGGFHKYGYSKDPARTSSELGTTKMPPDVVVVVSAHPDDAELGCGGTIARLADLGHSVTIVDLSDGEPTPSNPPGHQERRLKEAHEAAKILGCDRETLGLPNRRLFDSHESRAALGRVIRRLRPSLVLSQRGSTPLASPDHFQAYQIAEGGVFYSRLTWWETELGQNPWAVPLLMYYHTGREPGLEWTQFSFVVDISDQFDRKMASLRAYESQFGSEKEKQKIFDYYEAMSRFFGLRVGVEYGELLAVSRIPTPADFRFFQFSERV